MAWAKNGTPSTLTGAADVITISDLTAKKFNVFLWHTIATASHIGSHVTYNNNTNTVYATRYSSNGLADVTDVSNSYAYVNPALAVSGEFFVQYVCSISGQEKLAITFLIIDSTLGAGTAPNRIESVHKFVPSPDADITRIDITNDGSQDFNIGSNLSVIGTD